MVEAPGTSRQSKPFYLHLIAFFNIITAPNNFFHNTIKTFPLSPFGPLLRTNSVIHPIELKIFHDLIASVSTEPALPTATAKRSM